MGKFWSLLSKLMGSGTHYSRIDGFPGTHANGAIGTWHYFVLRIWRCLKCEEKIMQRVPNRIHSIKVHTAWLPLYYEQFGTFCIIFDICPLHKQHIVKQNWIAWKPWLLQFIFITSIRSIFPFLWINVKRVCTLFWIIPLKALYPEFLQTPRHVIRTIFYCQHCVMLILNASERRFFWFCFSLCVKRWINNQHAICWSFSNYLDTWSQRVPKFSSFRICGVSVSC